MLQSSRDKDKIRRLRAEIVEHDARRAVRERMLRLLAPEEEDQQGTAPISLTAHVPISFLI